MTLNLVVAADCSRGYRTVKAPMKAPGKLQWKLQEFMLLLSRRLLPRRLLLWRGPEIRYENRTPRTNIWRAYTLLSGTTPFLDNYHCGFHHLQVHSQTLPQIKHICIPKHSHKLSHFSQYKLLITLQVVWMNNSLISLWFCVQQLEENKKTWGHALEDRIAGRDYSLFEVISFYVTSTSVSLNFVAGQII